MSRSAVTPRAALVARARRHFAAFAASSVVLAGGFTAYEAAAGSESMPNTTGTSDAPDSTSHTAPRQQPSTGLTAPTADAPSDGSSNAS